MSSITSVGSLTKPFKGSQEKESVIYNVIVIGVLFCLIVCIYLLWPNRIKEYISTSTSPLYYHIPPKIETKSYSLKVNPQTETQPLNEPENPDDFANPNTVIVDVPPSEEQNFPTYLNESLISKSNILDPTLKAMKENEEESEKRKDILRDIIPPVLSPGGGPIIPGQPMKYHSNNMVDMKSVKRRR